MSYVSIGLCQETFIRLYFAYYYPFTSLGSDGEDTAKFEINLWFKEEELCEWETSDSKWRSEN